MRWLALVMAVSLAAAEELPKPDVPDPYGLGERLALIDHLRSTLHVVVPDDASDEQLVALYWQTVKAQPLPPEEALARDRRERLRRRLADEFRIEMPDDADEATLAARLDEAREQRAATPASDRVPASELDNLRARIARLSDEAREQRARVDECDARKRRLAAQFADGAKGLDALRGDANAYNARVAALNALKSQAADADATAADAVARATELDDERAKAEAELARLSAEAAPPAPERAATAAISATPAPAAVQAAELTARLKSAVVLIGVEHRGTGTGFFVTESGLLVTNAHVLGAAREAVALWDHDAHRPTTHLTAVQVDAEADLALLRADSGAPFAALPLGTDYALSEPVLAVGFPLAGAIEDALGTSPSDIVVSKGILASVRRKHDQVEWLQHDCAIASGNSGGPLLDLEHGAVIGVNSRVLDPAAAGGAGAALALAIPADQVKRLFAAHLAP